MKYLKNTELAKQYGVTVETISKWINDALLKKNALSLQNYGQKVYIANTLPNHILLKTLSKNASKFRNKRTRKRIIPKDTLYTLYKDEQILDFITTLEEHAEIDIKFTYFQDSVALWDTLYKHSLGTTFTNIPRNTHLMLTASHNYIDSLIQSHEFVRIIDIGVGNGLHIRDLIQFLLNRNIKVEYVGIDFSNDMIHLARENIMEWFGDTIQSSFHEADITTEHIRKFLFQRTLSHHEINIICLLGNTIENVRNPKIVLDIINASMSNHDYFILDQSLKESHLLPQLTFNPVLQNNGEDQESLFTIVQLLNILPEYYDIERIYDENHDTRLIRIRLKYDIEITFQTESIHRIITFHKNEAITLFRHKHHDYSEIINTLLAHQFKILYTITSADEGNIMTILKKKESK